MGLFLVLLFTSFALLFIGLYGLASKKNGIKILISTEIIVTAVNLLFITFGYSFFENKIDPQAETFVILSLSSGGALIGFILSLLFVLKKNNIDLSTLE